MMLGLSVMKSLNTVKTVETFKFYSGPPPSLGWWPVKINFIIPTNKYFTTSIFPEYVSWWNGEYWSVLIWEKESLSIVEKLVKHKTLNNPHHIFWGDRPKSWPIHSLT